MRNNTESPIAQNRAEELGFDLWRDFVIPPYFDSLDLLTARKPRMIIGGRGCGKTMLLRYLSHDTQFSKSRRDVPIEDIERIGVYWRIDTQFSRLLTKRGIEETEWLLAFEHMAVLIITREILRSVENVANSNYIHDHKADFETINFELLKSFNEDVPTNFFEFKQYIRKEFNKFQSWASNATSLEKKPTFFNKQFLLELINIIQEQYKVLLKTNYYVYIDEYENLLPSQQKLINTWLKHSEMPLIFNIAMKRNSFDNRNTLGDELLTDIQDFRTYDLESFFNEKVSYETFAAEILFLRLNKNEYIKTSINFEELRNPKPQIIEKRRSDQYKQDVLKEARQYLPVPSRKEMAEEIFQDNSLKRRLSELINIGLKNHPEFKESLTADDFKDYPTAAVVIPSLLHRKTLTVQEIIGEYKKLKEDKENKFNRPTDWITNNYFGSLLYLYEPLGRTCPLYSGFDAFCKLSQNNLRYFLELCNKSIINEKLNNSKNEIQSISVINQADAAKQASDSFLKEVKSFGHEGNRLYSFVLRIGTYLHHLNKRPAQSEPEINHFNIAGEINSEISIFLNECVKWSVLYEFKLTKEKGGPNSVKMELSEYQLNPMYTPYFNISYRKKRRHRFNVDDMNIIIFGELKQFEELLKSHRINWGNNDIETNLLKLF